MADFAGVLAVEVACVGYATPRAYCKAKPKMPASQKTSARAGIHCAGMFEGGAIVEYPPRAIRTPERNIMKSCSLGDRAMSFFPRLTDMED